MAVVLRHKFSTGTHRPGGAPSIAAQSQAAAAAVCQEVRPPHVAHMTTQQPQHDGPSRPAGWNEKDPADAEGAALPPPRSNSSPSPSSPGQKESEVGLASWAR